MGFDLFQGRRNYNEKCIWWARNEDDIYESQDLIMNRVPSGTFMAKEMSPETKDKGLVSNTFQYEKDNISIKSPDNLKDIKSNDLVYFRGECWIVNSVQRTKARLQSTVYTKDINCSHYWYLDLRK